MNIQLAHTLLQARGYSLEWRDISQGRRTFCHVYATHEKDEQFLCTMSRFAYTSTKAFRSMIERLEVRP